jgi:hypothetical protein
MNRSTIWLFLLHLGGNALLLWLGYYWLGVGESDAAHLSWSAFLILMIVLAALWLHGSALVYFHRDACAPLVPALRTALRHLAPLFLVAIAAAILYALLAWWHDSFGHKAFIIGSYATMKIRRPVAPSNVLRGFYAFIWLLKWMLVPVLFFRLAASVAVRGWRGFRRPWLRPKTPWFYWLEVCVLLVCALWVPFTLVDWIPKVDGFAFQLVSLGSRLGVGYLLFVFALLVLEFLTSAGKPRRSQSSTAASP